MINMQVIKNLLYETIQFDFKLNKQKWGNEREASKIFFFLHEI